ncbi:GNAT family N-acetyltransferase [Sorangium sp. So ce131]|uniref:GNAT family N-acetyltransferase n=1 Tax=Sorangium sp. So ce131 TaxID=3133282 RepID=UPI003F5F7EAC
MWKRLAPEGFIAPTTLETSRLRLRPLTVHDVVRDYDAVMTSVEHLAGLGMFGEWPRGLTLEQNLIDLGWHQKNHAIGAAFTYTVLSLDERTCLGCVYIEPTEVPGCEAEVLLWVRQSELASGLDEHLYSAVREWLSSAWPFRRVCYPGRE